MTREARCSMMRRRQTWDGRRLSALDVLEQVATADHQRVDARVERALEGLVLDLDGDVASIADVAQGAEEGPPADVAQAGDLRRMPELGIGENAVLVERVAVDPGVLGVDMEDTVAELVKGREV